MAGADCGNCNSKEGSLWEAPFLFDKRSLYGWNEADLDDCRASMDCRLFGDASVSLNGLRRWVVFVLLAVPTVVSCTGFRARDAEPGKRAGATRSYAQRATSTPYSGDLSIFEYPDRDKKLQIDRVMDLLGITAGKNVADIGAGSGWFTVRAARRVGTGGTVLAEDINPKAIEYIGNESQKEGWRMCGRCWGRRMIRSCLQGAWMLC